MLERKYQAGLIKKLKERFPGSVVIKLDSSYLQGIPDLLILWRKHWAVLEVKASLDSNTQPNQEYYVDLLGSMSYAAFICPENEEEVLDEIQRQFETRRKARLPKR